MRSTVIGLALIIATQVTAATPEQSPRQLIPAVAHVEGAGGSFWRTEVVVFNPSDRGALLRLKVLPSQREDSDVIHFLERTVPLEPRQTWVIYDALRLVPSTRSTGAMVVTGRDADDEPVPIVVTSRTWTSETESLATYGQGIPAVPWPEDGSLSETQRILPGLESSADFRTNLGLVNPTSLIDEVFSVEILDSEGVSQGVLYYWLNSYSHLQINDILAKLNLEGSGFTAVVDLVDWEGAELSPGPVRPDFVAYASKVDQRSNDPTYITGQVETTQSGLPRHRLIPAAASTEGSDESSWRSDVSIHSAGTESVAALLVELVPSGGEGIDGANPERLVTTIRGGQTKNIDDIMALAFPDHEIGALVIRSLVGGAGTSDLRVVSRTWTPAGDGEATMGQGIPGIPRRSLADPAVVPGLEASLYVRTNLGLVNPSANVRENFEIEIFDADGEAEGVLTRILEPWSHIQINSVLDELELEGGGYTAVVTMVGFENLMLRPSESWDPVFMAYGSRIDRSTNDPSFIEAVRLTPPEAAGQGDWVDFTTDEPWYRCPDEPVPDEATVVRAFDQDLHWFGSENHRSITREVEFPASQDWNQVGLKLKLECPENGLCDHWDRTGSLQMVLNPDDPEEEWEYIEIMRHITPYRVGMCQYVDITPLAHLLVGRQTLVSWIDTWVGPGHSDGEGWRISFDFVFYPGTDRVADDVVNIWGRRSIVVGNTDPDQNVDSQIEPVEVAIPADASRVEARLITTGHSFGNSGNCAEFCVMRQDLYLDGERRSVVPWRTDCEHNPVADQQGTWRYDRNGWCPGAITIGQTIDVTDLVTLGETATLDFDIRMQDGSEYENTNPGGGLTPFEWVSLQIYIYRE